ELAVVENTGGQYGACTPLDDSVGEMLELAHAARGNDGNRHGVGDGAGKRQVEAGLGAVAVHAGKQYFARAVAGHLAGPFDGVDARGLAPAVGKDLPARGFAGFGGAARVDGHHDALRAVVVGRGLDQLGVGHRRAVDGDFVGTGIEQPLDVGHLAHAAAHGKRNEYLGGDGLDDGQYQVAVVAGGRDVEKGEFVGALFVVAARDLDGVARVDQVDEV